MASFRPVHLIYLLVMMIVLEIVVLYLKHPDTFDAVLRRRQTEQSPKHHHHHNHGGGQAGKGHELHMLGEHATVGEFAAMAKGKREAGAPRVAILSLHRPTPKGKSYPSNVKSYANHWRYELVDASKSVALAAQALRAGKGDLSFLRGK